VPWLYIAVDYFVMQLGRVSDEVFIMDCSYPQCVIPSLGSIRDRQLILRLCVCGCSGLHCNAVWPCVRGSVHNGLQLSAVCCTVARVHQRQTADT